jgi:hypothetical protein
MRISLAGCALGVLVAGSACAQYVISAHSGVVQYVEGRAYLNNQVVDPKFGQFPDIKEQQEFRTEEGRAEILLTPGVFLRLGENSSLRMLSNRLTDTRVEVLSGSAIVECDDVPKDNSIQLVYKGNTMSLAKKGLYRIDTEPARFRVYDGEAIVKADSEPITLKSGKQMDLDQALTAQNFDRNDQDELYRWSDRRAGYIAQANVASASSANGSGYGYGGLGYSYGGLGYNYGGIGYGYGFLGGWAFNPAFGMYTYLPYSGFGYSPFGYTFFSPNTVYYAPSYGGYSSGNRTSNYPLHRTWASSSNSPVSRSGSAISAGHSSASGGGHAGSFGGGGGHAGGGAVHGR